VALPSHPAGRHRGAATAPQATREPGGAHLSRRTAPSWASARLDGLDLARGLAVLSMLVALLGPAGGLLAVSEYLAAPLFAVVIGASMGVRLSGGRRGGAAFVLDSLVGGVLLVALGIGLQGLNPAVVLVLPYLGALVLVLAPLALTLWRAPVLTLGLATAGAVLSPVVVGRAVAASPGDGPAHALLEWAAAGEGYRLTSLLPIALGGLALASVLPRAGEPPEGYAVAGVLLGASLAAYLLGRASADGADASSGTTAEIVTATLLATGTVVACFTLVAVLGEASWTRMLQPFLATGRLALTAYTLQVLVLAAVARVRGSGSDDGWWVLGGTAVVVVGTCWGLARWWGTGPLEWVLAQAVAPRRRRGHERGTPP
jgi:hypothetical protein